MGVAAVKQPVTNPCVHHKDDKQVPRDSAKDDTWKQRRSQTADVLFLSFSIHAPLLTWLLLQLSHYSLVIILSLFSFLEKQDLG